MVWKVRWWRVLCLVEVFQQFFQVGFLKVRIIKSFGSLKNEFLVLGQDIDLFGICRGIWSSTGSCYFIDLKFFFRSVWRRVVSVCSVNVEILYLVDDIFIYLKLMKFGIDFPEMRCMSFLVTFVTGNVLGVKFCFGFWLERSLGLGKFIGLL